jgi:hypothetical protein
MANHRELLQLIEARDEKGAAAHLEQGNMVYFMQAQPAEGGGQ